MSTNPAEDFVALLTSLKVGTDADLVEQVAEQLTAHPTNPSNRKIKLTVVGDGANIYVKTTPYLGGATLGTVVVGKGKYAKKGSGELWATHLPVGLSGVYKLSLESQTARLYDKDDEPIWVWKGEQTGLEGDVDIEVGTLHGLAKWVHEFGGYLV